MTKRIFNSICIVTITVFIALLILVMGVLYDYFTNAQIEQLKNQTALAAQGLEHEGNKYFEGMNAEDYRITWIASDGTVLYDTKSDSSKMENHLEREEVSEALKTGYGESTRYSETLTEKSLYCAMKLEDGSVVRVSVAQSTIFTLLLGMLRPIVIVIFIALIVSLILASRLSKKIVKPLNELDLENPLSNTQYDEISPLLRRISNQQKQLKRQSAELVQKQDEFDTVTENMKEGLILLNNRDKILSINHSAQKILGADSLCIGKEILNINRSFELQELLCEAKAGEGAERIIKIENRDYQFDLSPVFTDGMVSGSVLLLFDVTEKKKSEQMRREFTANVSHELKTPLHSISGYAELLANGMVKKQDIKGFAEKIHTEANRMIGLVEDIISLSGLDEGGVNTKRIPLDLYEIAKQVVSDLTSEAAAQNISLNLIGSGAVINGVPHLINGIIFNLCENAIKYNHPNGKVDVEISQSDTEVILTVKDTGIGIPASEQERIFERFYRVDKSRSKEVGGTGLGLSIVKHSAMLHKAKISLDSTEGLGTAITVAFPK